MAPSYVPPGYVWDGSAWVPAPEDYAVNDMLIGPPPNTGVPSNPSAPSGAHTSGPGGSSPGTGGMTPLPPNTGLPSRPSQGPDLPPGMGPNGYDLTSPAYQAWMNAMATNPGSVSGGPPTMSADDLANQRPPGGDATSNDSTATAAQQAASGAGSTVDMTDSNNNGVADIYEGGPGSPGYTGGQDQNAQQGFIDRDGNGIDDRQQTTVGSTGPFGPDYAAMWSQQLASNPQMGYGGNGQMGWGGAITTGTGAPISLGGGGGYGGGTTGGSNFSLPGGGGDGFSIPPAPAANFPDLTQIGTGAGGAAGGGAGTGGGFEIPPFQSPLAGYGTTGGTTGQAGGAGTAPLAGYGGTGASPNAGLVSDLANSFQNQTNAANQANMSRYDQGLSALLDRMNRAGLAINNLTNEGVRDIARQFEGARASADQGLIDRGLANTTVRTDAMRGLTTDEVQATNRYWDDQARQNLNEDWRQTGAITDWIGGRNDVGPNTADLANLASGVGAAGPVTTGGSAATSPVTGGMAPGPTTGSPSLGSGTPNVPVNPFLGQGANATAANPTPNGGGPVTRSRTSAETAAAESAPPDGTGGTATGFGPPPGVMGGMAPVDTQVLQAVAPKVPSGSSTGMPPNPDAGRVPSLSGYGAAPPPGMGGTATGFGPPPGMAGNIMGPGAPSLDTGSREVAAASAQANQMANVMRSAMSGNPTREQREMAARASNANTESSPSAGVSIVNGKAVTRPFANSEAPPPEQIAADTRAGREASWDLNSQLPSLSQFFTGPNPYGTTPAAPPPGQNPKGAVAVPPPGYDTQVSGTRNGNTFMSDVAAPQTQPSKPGVMGFPDPRGTGMPAAPRPADPMASQAQAAQNQMASQSQAATSAAMSSPLAGYGMSDPGVRGGDSGMSSYRTPISAPPPSMGGGMPSGMAPSPSVVPQRPEPVPFASQPPPSSGPLAGYGQPPGSMPQMMAPPGGMPPRGTQSMNAPPIQYNPPSLVAQKNAATNAAMLSQQQQRPKNLYG